MFCKSENLTEPFKSTYYVLLLFFCLFVFFHLHMPFVLSIICINNVINIMLNKVGKRAWLYQHQAPLSSSHEIIMIIDEMAGKL